jgi:hypothetical protein
MSSQKNAEFVTIMNPPSGRRIVHSSKRAKEQKKKRKKIIWVSPLLKERKRHNPLSPIRPPKTPVKKKKKKKIGNYAGEFAFL